MHKMTPEAEMRLRNGPNDLYDTMMPMPKKTNEEFCRMLGIPDDFASKILTLPDSVHQRFMEEIERLQPKKRKNWKGNLSFKNQLLRLKWSADLQRIHSANDSFFVVKRSLYDEATARILQVCVTQTGLTTAQEGNRFGNGSESMSALDVQRFESELLRTGNHKPNTWMIKTPAPGTREHR